MPSTRNSLARIRRRALRSAASFWASRSRSIAWRFCLTERSTAFQKGAQHARNIRITHMADLESRTVNKVMWRLLPFLMACYFIAFLDRVNVGFAHLQMSSSLGLSEAAFGFG